MVVLLKEAYAPKHTKNGRQAKLSREDQLFMTLKYWRQYVAQFELAFEFEVGEAMVHDTIKWVEDTLIKSGKFALPGKKVLLEEDNDIEGVLVDVTESPIERPKKTTEVVLWKEETTHHKNPTDSKSPNEGKYLHGSCRRENA